MQVLLSCTECSYQERGTAEGHLMNKIIMWNHIKKDHPQTAERIMRTYERVPSTIYDMLPEETEVKKSRTFTPRFA